ncbi:hypothetical protein LCGC14_0446410 [marine sediment metagenome]|uniref:Calcineurin-like phosphoesterase domain-containing protein n=1 Tax=marine sediment metagenome TaxID=412755 RepID=A0A0F9V5Z7_9ZZZZ
MSASKHHLKSDMLAALARHGGNASAAIKEVDVNIRTHQKWVGEDEDYRRAVTSIRGGVVANGNGAPQEPESMEAAVKREQKRLHDVELARELRQLQRTEAKRQEYVETVHDVLAPYAPTPLIPIPSTLTDNPEHFWLLLFSDWHVGQRTPIQTTGGIYEQTTEVTRWQVERLMQALKSIHDVQSKGYTIRNLLVVFDGDLVENDCMRASQAHGIDRLVTQQAIEVFDLMGYALRQLLQLPGIEKIEVHNIGGNHDRTSQKAGNAGLGELDYVDTYSWLVGTLLDRAFADEPRVVMTNWETYFGYTTYAGRRIVFEHGGSFPLGSGSYGGIPWYPIVNGANKLTDMLGGGDLVLFGHLHQPAVVPIKQDAWVVINGALPATSSYIQSKFKQLRTPTQWLINLHEEWGAIEFHPLYAPPPSLKSPGHVWRE